MNKLLQKANKQRTVGWAATIISGSFLTSRLLGLLRDRLLISHFGKGMALDAYNAAFTLPDLLFTLLVSGAFAVAFIPVFTEYLHKKEQKQAWKVANTLLNLLVIGTIGIALILIAFADPITRLIFHGFDEQTMQLTIHLTRIMMITPTLFAISSVWGSIQQAYNRFLIYSLASVLYNVGIILGIVFLTGGWGVYGVAWGVVLGTVLQATLQRMGLAGLGYRWRPNFNIRLRGVRQTIKLIIPRAFDQGIDQVNYAVEKSIGSGLGTGSITSFTYANNLKNVPLSLIGAAITTAVFPRLAAGAVGGSTKKLVQVFVHTARLILFLSIPAAIMSVLARGYIVRLLYGFGDADTANTLGWFALSIVFTSLFFLVSRVYYAMQDTKTPLFVSLVSVSFNIVFSYFLSARVGIVGLAMSASLVSAMETIVLLIILRHRIGNIGERQIMRGLLRMLVGAACMSVVLYGFVHYWLPLYSVDLGFTTIAPKFLVVLAASTVSYIVPCYLLRLREARTILGRLGDIIMRQLNLT